MKKHQRKLEEKRQEEVQTFQHDVLSTNKKGKERASMTKEKRMVEGMPPDVKKFYLEFKKKNPGRETEYYKAFVKMKQQENQKRLKEEEYEKRLKTHLVKSIQDASLYPKSN